MNFLYFTLIALIALLFDELAARHHSAVDPTFILVGMLVAMFLVKFRDSKRLFNVSLWSENSGSVGSFRVRFALAVSAIVGLLFFPSLTKIGGEFPGPERQDFAVAIAGVAVLFIRSVSKQDLAAVLHRQLLYVVVVASWLAMLLAPRVNGCVGHCGSTVLSFGELALGGVATMFAVYKVRAVGARRG